MPNPSKESKDKDALPGDVTYPIHLDEPVQENPAPPIMPDPPPTPQPVEPPTNWAAPHEDDPRYQAGASPWTRGPIEHEGPTPNVGGVPTVAEDEAAKAKRKEATVKMRLQGPASYGPIDEGGTRVTKGETIFVPASKVQELLGVGFVKVED